MRPPSRARCLARLGDVDGALRMLDRAVDAGYRDHAILVARPDLGCGRTRVTASTAVGYNSPRDTEVLRMLWRGSAMVECPGSCEPSRSTRPRHGDERRSLVWLVVVWIGVSLAAGEASARQSAAARAEYDAKRREVLVYAAQRRLELGVWCRDQGLVPQASANFLRAVEVADGHHPGAMKVLGIMRALDDRFWKARRKNPSASVLKAYAKRDEKLVLTMQKERLKLAQFAARRGLDQEAIDGYREVLRDTGRPLEVDTKGRIVLDVAPIPVEFSERLLDGSIVINDQRYLRDAVLSRLPDVDTVYEVADEALLVRSLRSQDEAATIFAAATQLLPHLEDDLGGRPTRRMTIFVFDGGPLYTTYLDAAGLSTHRLADGVADRRDFVAAVRGGGSPSDTMHAALHELAHLFEGGVTPANLPSWYREGFAETYGGEGTFTWDSERAKLEPGGRMAPHRIREIASPADFIPLAELMRGTALDRINTDAALARRFYAESWAFVRFLREGADRATQAAFERWVAQCRGAALGAEAGEPRRFDAAAASELFDAVVAKDLPALESAFKTYLVTDLRDTDADGR